MHTVKLRNKKKVTLNDNCKGKVLHMDVKSLLKQYFLILLYEFKFENCNGVRKNKLYHIRLILFRCYAFLLLRFKYFKL